MAEKIISKRKLSRITKAVRRSLSTRRNKFQEVVYDEMRLGGVSVNDYPLVARMISKLLHGGHRQHLQTNNN